MPKASKPRVRRPAGPRRPAEPKPARDARGLKLSAEDAVELKGQVRSAFADIARRYYLEEDVEPVLRVGKNALHITIPVRKSSGECKAARLHP